MKKGFTLIELLAVIVILAIIALIATPVILNIIDDSRKSSNEQSINMYGKAVENAIANYLLKNPTDTDITLDKISEYIKYDGNKVECDTININKNGSVLLANCKVNGAYVSYSYGISICKAVNTSQKGSAQIGTKYNCAVNDSTSYNFYVLSTSGDNVSLIMEQNLANNIPYVNLSDFSQHVGTPNWLNSSVYNGTPVIFTELDRLTSTWEYIPKINKTYPTIYGKSVTLTGRARLATVDDIAGNACKEGPYCSNFDYCGSNRFGGYYTNCESWILGNYWTMSVSSLDSSLVYAMNTAYNTLDDFGVNKQYSTDEDPINTNFGIRPVITVNRANLG